MELIDYSILNILKHNARETASNISKEVHLSVSSVMNRIRQMEDSGIIKGYEVKGEADANGYYATYFDYTKCEDGSANPYISAITNKDVAVTE